MHLEIPPGRITMAATEEELELEWTDTTGRSAATFYVEDDTLTLTTMITDRAEGQPLEVGELSLGDLPTEYRLLLRGLGFELRGPPDTGDAGDEPDD